MSHGTPGVESVPIPVTDVSLSPISSSFQLEGLTAGRNYVAAAGTRSGRGDWRRRKLPRVSLPVQSPPQRSFMPVSRLVDALSPIAPVSTVSSTIPREKGVGKYPEEVMLLQAACKRTIKPSQTSVDDADGVDRRHLDKPIDDRQLKMISTVSTGHSAGTGLETSTPSLIPVVSHVQHGSSRGPSSLYSSGDVSCSATSLGLLLSPPDEKRPLSTAPRDMSSPELLAFAKGLFQDRRHVVHDASGPSQGMCDSAATPYSVSDHSVHGREHLFVDSRAGSGTSGRNSAPPAQQRSSMFHCGGIVPSVPKSMEPVPKRRKELVLHDGRLRELVDPAVSNSQRYPAGVESGESVGTVKSKFTSSESGAIIKSQRATNGLWSGSWAFPGQDHNGGYDTLEDTSCSRCPQFLCHGIRGCSVGDCASCLESVQVYKIRLKHGETLAKIGARGGGSRLAHAGHVLEQLILPYFDKQSGKWSGIPLEIGTATSVHVCVAAYALVLGYSGSVAADAICAVATEKVQPCEPLVRQVSGVKKGVIQGNVADVLLIEQYIRDIHLKGECQPVPGAHRQKQTVVNQKTMKAKWEDCQHHFRHKNLGETGYTPPGSKTLFKKLWRAQDVIKEKKMLANPKCSICSRGDKLLIQWSAPPSTPEKRAYLELLKKKLIEHERDHLNDRTELDNAAYMATVNKFLVWCLLVDGATQRNFVLPKFKCRPSKNMAGNPEWNFSLMGVYAFGFGFRPFLAHDSVSHGSNYTWTCIWLVLCEMRDHYGRWPDILHLQFDNCSGDNKNFVTWAICAWLVATGRVKQVRIFFLQVGHTHILIDQIFGVITCYLKGCEFAIPQDLINNIDNGLRKNGNYMAAPVQWLHTLFNFNSWCKDELDHMPITHFHSSTKLNDELGGYNGCYDFLLERDEEKLALIQYRERCSFPWWPKDSKGAQVIRKIATRPPSLAEMNPMSVWGRRGTNDLHSMLVQAAKHLRCLKSAVHVSEYHAIWRQHVVDIKVDPCLMAEEHKLQFKHFSIEVPRLSFIPPVSAGENGVESAEPSGMTAAEESAWAYKWLGKRDEPFVYDPCTNSEQSVSELARVRARHELSCLRVPVPRLAKDTPLFFTRLVIATSPLAPEGSSGVDLYKIEGFVGSESPYDLEATVKCSIHKHSPNPDVSGLWGEFVRLSPKESCPVILTRRNILVYNVELFDILRGTGRSKTRHKFLEVESLRVLSRANPEEYGMPSELPDTHIRQGPHPAGKPSGARKPRASGAGPDNKARPTAARPDRPVSTARGKRKSRESSEEEEEDEEEDEDEDESAYEDDDEDEEDDDVDEQPHVGDESDEEALDRDFLGSDYRPTPGVLELPQPTPLLRQGLYGFANMKGDPAMSEFDCPVSPFYCEGSEGAPPDHLWVRYFHRAKGDRPNGKKIGREYAPKTWTYPKFWVDPTFGVHKSCLKDPKKKKKIPDEYFETNWRKELLHRQYVLDVEVPRESVPRGHLRVEALILRMEFVMEKLVPLLKEHGIID